MRKRHVVIAVVAIAGASLLAGSAVPLAARAEDPQPGTITVSGMGTVAAVPDTATISFGVVTQAATASQALSTNSAAAERMIAAVKSAGVDAKDVRTDVVSLSPRYSDDGDAIVGYTASNSVTATIRELSRAGAVIDAAVGAGANSVQGPSLERSDAAGLYREALKLAVADARTKAEALAAATGMTLGAVSSVTEGSQGPIPLTAAAKDAAPAAVPIEPGTQDVTAGVTVVFRAS
jgi:uncharacterized protein YggE